MRARAFLSLVRMEVARCMQFRISFWMRLALYLFWAVVRVAILAAFFNFGANAQDAMTLGQAAGMAWLLQICLALVGVQVMDMTLHNRITSGDIALDLLRPFQLYPYMYGHLMANKIAQFLPFALPLYLIGLLVPGDYGLIPPASALNALAFLIALTTGFMLSCACAMLTYAASLDVRFGRNLSNFIGIVIQVLGGALVPLQLFPDSWQSFLRMQPFAGMFDLPARLYVGSAPLSEFPLILLTQVIWLLTIVAAGMLWVNRSGRRLVLQGG